MKLPIALPFGKKENKTEYFLALLLHDEKVTAVIFEEMLAKVRVVGECEEQVSTSIEKLEIEEFLNVVDAAVSKAAGNLPEGVSATLKTVFGLKETWVDDTKIKKEYLDRLKKVSEALDLSPVGFIVVSEAIAHLLAREEGAPVSGILVELAQKNITISVLRAGRVVETKTTSVEESAAKTTDKLLHHFTAYEVFPSRIILLNGHDSDDITQEFTAHTWSKSLPFLHVPQITTLPKRFGAKAVLYGAASQMGFEITGELEEKLPIVTSTPELQQEDEEKKEEDIQEDSVVEEADKEEQLVQKDEMEAVGFVKEKDLATLSDAEIADMQQKAKEGEQQEEEPEGEEDEPKFAINGPSHEREETKEVQSGENNEKEEQKSFLSDAVSDSDNLQFPKEQEQSRVRQTTTASRSLLPFVTFPFMAIRGIVRGFTPKGLPFGSTTFIAANKKLIFLPPMLLVFGIVLFVLYITMVKATVVLHVDPKVVEEDLTVTFTPDETTDIEKGIIAAKPVSQEEEGSVTTDATGKKEVGEKAKGTVTLYSSLSKEEIFEKGTVITASNGLKYALDETVKVASSSGISDVKTVKAAVLAQNIGKEYNLPSGGKFTIGSFSSSEVDVKNDSAFSGGSKKEVTVIAQKDIEHLREELPKKLEEKAKENMKKTLSVDDVLLDGFTDITVDDEQLSKKVGEEASSVTLTGRVIYEGLAYSKKDAEQLAEGLLAENQDKQMLAAEGLSYELQDIERDDDVFTASLAIKGMLVPKIEEEQLIEAIKGKSFTDAGTVISGLPQVSNAEIILHPSLPFLPQLLPRMQKNIAIEVKNNG